ncbi:MAG: ATP-binding protein, partial [Bacteroidales bacterium]|nr:ATP-binding protein [Bacteroidales bacterium]
MIAATAYMFEFPLKDVIVEHVIEVPFIQEPSYEGSSVKVSQNEFLGISDGTGIFYVRDGFHVKYSVEPGADPDRVRLYLENQVLVALLHQRKVINFHASSFIHERRGVMILGGTGAGKSSLTVSFARQGAGFLTDDFSPVVFRNGLPHIW